MSTRVVLPRYREEAKTHAAKFRARDGDDVFGGEVIPGLGLVEFSCCLVEGFGALS